VAQLRRMMLDELQRRNYAQNTVRTHLKIVERFAKHFGRSPDKLGPEQIRQYQAHLFQDCRLSPGTVQQHVAALRFLYVKTLKRPYMHEPCPCQNGRDRYPRY
jgi:integrase/recombinase XerD